METETMVRQLDGVVDRLSPLVPQDVSLSAHRRANPRGEMLKDIIYSWATGVQAKSVLSNPAAKGKGKGKDMAGVAVSRDRPDLFFPRHRPNLLFSRDHPTAAVSQSNLSVAIPRSQLIRPETSVFHPAAPAEALGARRPIQQQQQQQQYDEDDLGEELLPPMGRCPKRRKECGGGSSAISSSFPDTDPERAKLAGVEAGLQFACPFLKMFPWNFVNRKPCLGGWKSTHRLKEHLYRQHLIQETCNRCYEAFDDVQQLISHQRSDRPCQRVERGLTQGIDARQLSLLKSKKKVGGSEYEKCRRIYKTIWPEVDEAELPCPYWSASLLASPKEPSSTEFREYLGRELSPHLEQRLDKDFSQASMIPRAEVARYVERALHELHGRFLASVRAQYNSSSTIGSQQSPGKSASNHSSNPASSSTDDNERQQSDYYLEASNLDEVPCSVPQDWSDLLAMDDADFDFDFSNLACPTVGSSYRNSSMYG